MKAPDDTDPEAQLKAAPPDQRTGRGPEDLLKITDEERARRRATFTKSGESGDAPPRR
jgi:hypothetical protein